MVRKLYSSIFDDIRKVKFLKKMCRKISFFMNSQGKLTKFLHILYSS